MQLHRWFSGRRPSEEALRTCIAPHLNADICLENLVIDPKGQVTVILSVDPHKGQELEPVRQQIMRILESQKGVKAPQVVMTASRPVPAPPPAPAKKTAQLLDIPVPHIIAVASGKGGVGKSTVAANLAVALAASGLKIGLLDADIYGPSQPRMMGLAGHKPVQGEDGRLTPPTAHGVRVMSIGFMVDEDAPMIWRGPMIQSALVQLLRDVIWDGLDILIIDMPPGTGDTQLTLAQKVRLSGAVIVSTPQDIALIDAKKGLAMFQQTGVPILGMVENMSVFCCPHCGTETDIFRQGGTEQTAQAMGVPFLGALPLDPALRQWSDNGIPAIIADPTHRISQCYAAIATAVQAQLNASATTFPTIIMDDLPLTAHIST